MIVVRLDNANIGAGPATVVAKVESVAEFLAIATDRDGARDPKLRLWRGEFSVGERVVMARLVCGTGEGVIERENPIKPTGSSSYGEWRAWLDAEIREAKATADSERYNRAWSRFLLNAPKPQKASRANNWDTGHQACDGQGCPRCCPADAT